MNIRVLFKKAILLLSLIMVLLPACTEQGRRGNLDIESLSPNDNNTLLDYVQQQYFKFIWDASLPNSGLSHVRILEEDPERDFNTITVGSSGFSIAGIVVGIERGFITRKEGVKRLEKIVTFLERADRYHGMWSHWIDDRNAKTIPFANPNSKDNGGDVVESAFLAEGLLVARQYLLQGNRTEKKLARRYDALWRGMEWDWYTKGGEDVLYWHWSPDYEWEKDFPLRGYNECLIAYILGASSPTHPISKDAYYNGWARAGAIKRDTTLFNIPIGILHNTGREHVGPLFWTAFSFVGFNPRNLVDSLGINYFVENVSQVMIQRAYCIENPHGFKGYGPDMWGMTAGYSTKGYKAHNTKNDRGVISPSAVLAAMPYAPEQVISALRHFQFDLGDRLMGPYGYYDAYVVSEDRVIKNYLGNNQCAVLPMIENYRTGLVWDLFMSSPEIQEGLSKLGFTKED